MKKKLKKIKLISIIHSLIYFLIGLIHLLIYYKIYWKSIYAKKLFYLEIFIIFSFSPILIVIVILLTFLTLSSKLLQIFQLISKIFLFIFFINGFLISLAIYNNAGILISFYKVCPYSYDIRDLTKIFDNYQINNNNIIKTKCNYRRCIINNIYIKADYYAYSYVCNFKENDKRMSCLDIIKNNLKLNDILFNYIDYCQGHTIFYICEKINDMIFNKISYDIVCPNKSDVSINIGMIFLLFFLNCFACSLPWLIEYYSYYELILAFALNININNNNPNNINYSLKETNYTSNIDEKNNISQTFQKEPTQLIIIDNRLNNNENNCNSNIKVNNYIYNINIIKKKEILFINKNKNEKDSLNKEIINKNNTDKSKTESKLINDNKNNDIFKVINNNIKYYNVKKELNK